MFSLLIWAVYGIFVGSIAKAVIPGEQNMGFFQTIALGVAGSYVGGAILYMLGSYSAISPTGIFMGIVGSVISMLVYSKLTEK
jgi:uncharacterized membrane protein YeaQ/YmgE (transglycosylase-associated protein family)